MASEKIGALLLQENMITPGELSLGLAVQRSLPERERLGQLLCHYGLLTEERLTTALAAQCGWPVFNGEYSPDVKGAQLLGMDFLRGHGVLPVACADGCVFVVADPYDTFATDHILSLFGAGVKFFTGMPGKIGAGMALLEKEALVPACGFGQASVKDAAAALLDEAVAMGATDIHIEPSEKALDVRLRVDGVLRFHRSFPLHEHGRLVNIFFNRAEISAGDFLRFHDARFEHSFGLAKVDVRLSHLPCINGSSLVLRLLDKSRSAVSLENLGYTAAHWNVIEAALEKPHGIILLTGPTGCGKTTTLYAMLGHLKGIGCKVVSVEDPVEVRMPLVTQVPVDIRKGHDFHQVTRAFLRHDPDIMLIGEIRDEKTAAEAVRAAITGHRIFSTLHTNDAVSAILRLHDLGVGHSYIANTLACVIAQRLVRKLCPHCRREELVTPACVAQIQQAFINGPGQVVYVANTRGCSRCFEGYNGRTVIAETLLIDDEIRFMIEQGLVHEIFLKVKKERQGFCMQADAARLVAEGITSLEEAARVVGA